MSRKEIVGQVCTIAFGVDHVTGAFVQLWNNPAHDQDCAFVVIDSNGIRIDNEDGSPIPRATNMYLQTLQKRIDAFRHQKLGQRFNLSETDVVDLAKAVGGFPDIAPQVYKLFGDSL